MQREQLGGFHTRVSKGSLLLQIGDADSDEDREGRTSPPGVDGEVFDAIPS